MGRCGGHGKVPSLLGRRGRMENLQRFKYARPPFFSMEPPSERQGVPSPRIGFAAFGIRGTVLPGSRDSVPVAPRRVGTFRSAALLAMRLAVARGTVCRAIGAKGTPTDFRAAEPMKFPPRGEEIPKTPQAGGGKPPCSLPPCRVSVPRLLRDHRHRRVEPYRREDLLHGTVSGGLRRDLPWGERAIPSDAPAPPTRAAWDLPDLREARTGGWHSLPLANLIDGVTSAGPGSTACASSPRREPSHDFRGPPGRTAPETTGPDLGTGAEGVSGPGASPAYSEEKEPMAPAGGGNP